MKSLNSIIATIVTVSMLTTVHASNNDDYQHNVLLNPSTFQLKAEANGRIMIYDQMDNETVELALNTQFARIDNMMFIRTQHVQEDGSIEEDDDCND